VARDDARSARQARRVLKPTLIAVFVGVVGTGILLVGYVFNVLF
jgi:uncharacterized membrane protein YraQ (UPF0718 family)